MTDRDAQAAAGRMALLDKLRWHIEQEDGYIPPDEDVLREAIDALAAPPVAVGPKLTDLPELAFIRQAVAQGTYQICAWNVIQRALDRLVSEIDKAEARAQEAERRLVSARLESFRLAQALVQQEILTANTGNVSLADRLLMGFKSAIDSLTPTPVGKDGETVK